MVTERGEICWIDLGTPDGHRPAMRRPVIVIQTEPYNRSRLGTAIVVSMTTNLSAADKPGNVFLSAASTGLPKDSVANVTQISTVNKYDLEPTGTVLPILQMRQLDAGLRAVTGL
jgi:mRNA interferase MazF